jgi:hypothetical protein
VEVPQNVVAIIIENHVIILWQAVYGLQFYCISFIVIICPADVGDAIDRTVIRYEATVIAVADTISVHAVVIRP